MEIFIAYAIYAAAILTPQAIPYARLRWGIGAAVIVYLTLCGIAYIFAGPFFALEFGTVFGALGLFLSISAKTKTGVERVFLYTFIPLILTSILNFVVLVKFQDKWDIKGHIARSLGAGQFEKALEQSTAPEQQKIDPKLEERIERIKKVLIIAFPSINVFLLAALVLFHLIWLKVLWPELAKERGFYELARWRAKEHFIWPFLVSGFSILLPKNSPLFFAGLNIFIISTIPFLFQGMSILSFFMKKYKLPLVARIITYVLVFSQVWFILLVFVGLADIWADLRKLKSVAA